MSTKSVTTNNEIGIGCLSLSSTTTSPNPTAAGTTGNNERHITRTTPTPTPYPSSSSSYCTYYNSKKRKACTQFISPKIPWQFKKQPNFQPLYCETHQSIYTELYKKQKQTTFKQNEGTSSLKRNQGKRRIPCPVDPRHMIYEGRLEYHLKKCQKALLLQKEQSQSFYKPNINCGGCGKRHHYFRHRRPNKEECTKMEPEKSTTARDGDIDAKDLVVRILRTYVTTFMPNSSNNEFLDDDEALLMKSLTLEDMYNAIPQEDLYPNEERSGINEAFIKHRVKAGGIKHMRQIGSIVGHARRAGLLDSNTKVVLEMGAGRATTGFAVAGVCGGAATATTYTNARKNSDERNNNSRKVKLVVVEKGKSAKSKADLPMKRIQQDTMKCGTSKKHKKKTEENDDDNEEDRNLSSSLPPQKSYFETDNVKSIRIKCDLAHVCVKEVMDRVVEDTNNNKSFCQEVTNKSGTTNIQDTSGPYATSNNAAKRSVLVLAKHLCGAGTDLALKAVEPIRDTVKGVVLSTCCHGICDWDLYVGRDWLCEAMCSHKAGESFGKSEFDYMRKWATGTVVGDGRREPCSMNKPSTSSSSSGTTGDEVEPPEHKLVVEDEEEEKEATKFQIGVSQISKQLNLKCGSEGLGRACQRLIDYGRMDYIRNHLLVKKNSANQTCDGDEEEKVTRDGGGGGGGVKLLHYVDKSVTPQNAMLLGVN